jgi:ankyrin repeat protein
MDCRFNRYLLILPVIILFSLPTKSFSQPVVLDTTVQIILPLSKTQQLDFNNYLLLAASSGSIPALDWLLRNGAEIDFKTPENATPLMLAVANNKTEAVKLLLNYYPDINIKTEYSETPLIAAAKNGNMEIAEALIRDNADINLTDNNGAAPIHYAALYGYFYLTDMLLYYNADKDLKSDDGTTPLMAAIWSGYPDIADLLIRHNADCGQKDNKGFTPLMIACQTGDTVIIRLLLDRNADLYQVNNFKYDALDIAIRADNTDAAEYLLNNGYKPEKRKSGTADPYSVAIKFNRKEALSSLKEHKIIEREQQGFDRITLSAFGMLTTNDHFFGANIAFKDPKLKGGLLAGVDFKPTFSKVLIHTGESTYYQYFDKSSLIYGGIFRDFSLSDNPFTNNWVFTVSASAGYGLGNKLVGSNIIPWNKVIFIPSVGLKRTGTNFAVFANIDYLKTPFYKIGPVWLRLGISYTMFFDQNRAVMKKIKWFNDAQ